MSTTQQDTHLPLGKELAANGNRTLKMVVISILMAVSSSKLDKKTRDAAVKELKKYLSTGNSLSEIELIKVWKGIFYCKD
ncbi:hypothetical protein BDB01DRAFT_441265 [Pilobolus umbonatus]|nr:hypothetical protein BDB01DRAFT_441265 [Pilobolus umbonatus]